ncbi:MAG: protein phosphatase 2C domain-containing protein [Anaerolineae bacterium]|nr:protein phosphatase 2C domain-containing protein [Anaerolineae bacterium]
MGDFFGRLKNKILGNKKPERRGVQINEANTAPLTEEQIREISGIPPRIEPHQLIVGSGHHVGRQRENNEDSLFALSSTLSVNSKKLPFGIYIVADGMGGHKNGELASEMAIRAMSSYLLSKLTDPLFGTNPHPPEDSLQELMRQGVNNAHDLITKNAPGGGSTLTAVLIMDSQMTIAHVGDSRAYAVYLDGRIQSLTRDHSLVKRLEELGQINAEEAAIHPQKSMLYRALGVGEPSEPDIFTATLPDPGYLLVCSDGLWGVIPETEIFSIITSAPSPQRACQNLIDAANAAGGPDNIAAVLVRMSE